MDRRVAARLARPLVLAFAVAASCNRPSRVEPSDVASSIDTLLEPTASTTAEASATLTMDAPPTVSATPLVNLEASPLASTSALASGSALPPGAPNGPPTNQSEKVFNASYEKDPFFFTPAFDGSMRFSLWADVARFARAEEKRTGKRPHFTFFVNAVYYSTHPGHSQIGQAHSDLEVLVRRALTQEALNEGHDIASHGVGHDDGRAWTTEEWNAELTKFQDLMITSVFQPIKNEDGSFVFPRFAPKDGAADGETGARCNANDDCANHDCVAVSASDSFCTQRCNMKKPCPDGLACGAPAFQDDTDVCLPPPKFPVEYEGKALFFANGTPNFKHPALKIHRYLGFRAPFLASNDAMYEALIERGFVYDTSQASAPRAPYALTPPNGSKSIFEFPLMPHVGAKTIPMDFNYRLLKVSREDMLKDYENAIVESYANGHIPWNVGHHFATWDDGAYLKALFDAVSFTLDGCPSEKADSQSAGGDKEHACPGADVVSFEELYAFLRRKGASIGR